MIGWAMRHWRDLALAALLIALGAMWRDELSAAYVRGAADGCGVLPW